jgi:serine/threonine protein kinase
MSSVTADSFGGLSAASPIAASPLHGDRPPLGAPAVAHSQQYHGASQQQQQQQHGTLTGSAFMPSPHAPGAASPSGSLPRPTREPWALADFDVGPKIGHGRFGKVYLARERASQRAVVLKVIAKDAVLRFDMKHQVRREAELQHYCRHRNVVRLHAYFWDLDRIFLVLEHCEGGDLLQQLDRAPSRRLPEAVVADYTRQIALGLQYMHQHGIIHRDLKPDNILVRKGVVKIADFTWAVHCDMGERRRTLCGTLDYLPPELVTQATYEAPADVWCLGVIVYELLCGATPFERPMAHETYLSIQRCDYEVPAFVSAGAADLVRRLLVAASSERLALSQVLLHPWVLKHERPAAPSPSRAVVGPGVMRQELLLRREEQALHTASSVTVSTDRSTQRPAPSALGSSGLASAVLALGSSTVARVEGDDTCVSRVLDLAEPGGGGGGGGAATASPSPVLLGALRRHDDATANDSAAHTTVECSGVDIDVSTAGLSVADLPSQLM